MGLMIKIIVMVIIVLRLKKYQNEWDTPKSSKDVTRKNYSRNLALKLNMYRVLLIVILLLIILT